MMNVGDADVFISVAAVADWRVENPSSEKLKKQAGEPPALNFVQNPDILAEVASLKDGPFCVGFAAETQDLSKLGAEKRIRKGIPMLIGNLAQHVMDADHTTVSIFDERGEQTLPTGDKQGVARQIVQAIAERLPKR